MANLNKPRSINRASGLKNKNKPSSVARRVGTEVRGEIAGALNKKTTKENVLEDYSSNALSAGGLEIPNGAKLLRLPNLASTKGLILPQSAEMVVIPKVLFAEKEELQKQYPLVYII
ncbi:hypothetical protein HON22_04230 [Candidatus Peregrinibacteria bacterium]|jgi:hypothetical protein|nr:hypothetical protein [Candidatus Peregrinibacteria bacterium]